MISQNQCFTDVDASLWSPDPKSLSNSGKLPSEYSHLLPQSDYMKPQNIFLENSCLDSIKCGGKFEDFFFMGPELGRGQFGVVNLVIERRTGNKLACKLLDKRRIKTEEQRIDIEREIAIMANLRGHSSVVELKAVFEDMESIFLVMERCEGGELFDLINEVGNFSEADAADIFSQLVNAVHFCHSRNVMHRDIKPENILLSKDPRDPDFQNEVLLTKLLGAHSHKFPVKLADFGLATFVEQGKKVEGVAGSPLYLAPEVVLGKYDKTADIWSLGVILYILLCGTAPFCGENDLETLRLIDEGRLDFSSAVWSRVSPQAIDLICRLLCRDSRLRPSPEEILKHPWIVQNLSCDVKLHRVSSQNLALNLGSERISRQSPSSTPSNLKELEKLDVQLLQEYLLALELTQNQGRRNLDPIASVDASTAALIASGLFSHW